ncbi:MAG: (2Fe-2S)-binding protein [Firmicutes bacterium]|nr:(2Fe-2S)-binding protein [Bacillota bacterium]
MDETIICRCSDVTKEDIRKVINEGFTTFEEIKRILRVGMGPCQGRTCTLLVLKEISDITKIPIKDLMPATFRPPVKGIKLGLIKDGRLEDEKDS